MTFFAAQAVATAAAMLAVAPVGPQAVLGALGQDAAVAIALAAAALLLPARATAAAAFAIVVFVACNAALVVALGTPLSIAMLKGADAAMSDSIEGGASAASAAAAVAVLAASAVAWFSCARLRSAAHAGAIWTAASCLTLSLLALGSVEQPAHRSAVWHLVRTSLPRVPEPSAEAAAGSPLRWRRAEPARLEPGVAQLRGAARGRSVVLVVLESAAARHLGPWSERPLEFPEPMPFLAELAPRSLTVRTAWTVYPESVKGLTALLRAAAPAPDREAEDHARLPSPAIATLLAERGYATALFHSGHFRFLGMEDVLLGMGFDEQRDAERLGAPSGSSFGVPEEAAVESALEWVAALPAEEPFFLCYLPVAGHHPYDSPARGSKLPPFPTDSMVGCYHNALRYADESLQALWQGLTRIRAPGELLLAVVGDHGEAFGEHAGNFGHTFALFEENLRVPLLFHAPGVTDRGAADERLVVERVASYLDVVPTLLDLAGLPACRAHEGTSLLAPERRLALAFTDWGDLLVAVRDERFKLVHEVLGGGTRLYDLAADPGETRDVAAEHPERVAAWRELARGWLAGRGPWIRGPALASR